LILLGIPPLGATITLHRVARVCQRQLSFLVFMYVRETQPRSRGSTAGLVPIPTVVPRISAPIPR